MIRIATVLLLATLTIITTCGEQLGERVEVRPIMIAQAYPVPRFSPAGPVEGRALYRLSSEQADFGGFSAIAWSGDQLTLFSDHGLALDLPGLPEDGGVFAAPLRRVGANTIRKSGRDIEAATALGEITWLALENTNAIMRVDGRLAETGTVLPRAMREWPANSGPEALARLADGRFLVLREGKARPGGTDPLEGLLFAGDPVADTGVEQVSVTGAQGYHPVDAATTPDGRVLVLLRKLRFRWPLVFDTRLALLDPADFARGHGRLRMVSQLSPPLPHDNYEGLAVRMNDARWQVWLVSDDNNSHFQASWLAHLTLDPAALPD